MDQKVNYFPSLVKEIVCGLKLWTFEEGIPSDSNKKGTSKDSRVYSLLRLCDGIVWGHLPHVIMYTHTLVLL